MKISPVAAQGIGGVSGQAPAAPIPRSLKLTTNATPGQEVAPSTSDATETPAAEGETQPLSPKYAELARQRRALQVKEREIQARELALSEKEKATPDANAITLEKLKADPIGVILGAGLTYDDLTQAIVSRDDNGQRVDPNKLKSELEESLDRKLSERDQLSRKQALTEMQKEATRLAQGSDFELVRETGNIPKVMELIEKTYDSTGEILDISEALKLVEDELFKDYSRLTKLQKFQTEAAPAPQTARPQMRTLTNRDTAQVPMTAKQRALAAFNGTLRR